MPILKWAEHPRAERNAELVGSRHESKARRCCRIDSDSTATLLPYWHRQRSQYAPTDSNCESGSRADVLHARDLLPLLSPSISESSLRFFCLCGRVDTVIVAIRGARKMQSIVEETGSESDSSSESETERAGSAPRFKRDYLAEAEYTRPELDRQPVVVQFAQTVRQSHGHLLEYLSILDAIALRTVCHGLRRIVMDHAWDDASDAPETRLCKYPRRWRMAFPRALSVSTRRATSEWLPFFAGCKRVLLSSVAATAVGAASNLTAATDGDLAALHGASVLVLAGCNLPPGLSSLGFAHFRGVRVLDISGNKRVRLTDGALACLGGVRELSIGGVLCSSVTPAGWAALAGVASLLAPNCWGLRVTDAALEHVAGVRVIDLTSTDRSEVTDGGLAHIAGARVVRLGATPTGTYGGVDRAPVLVTDAGFAAFARVEVRGGWGGGVGGGSALVFARPPPLRRVGAGHHGVAPRGRDERCLQAPRHRPPASPDAAALQPGGRRRRGLCSPRRSAPRRAQHEPLHAGERRRRGAPPSRSVALIDRGGGGVLGAETHSIAPLSLGSLRSRTPPLRTSRASRRSPSPRARSRRSPTRCCAHSPRSAASTRPTARSSASRPRRLRRSRRGASTRCASTSARRRAWTRGRSGGCAALCASSPRAAAGSSAARRSAAGWRPLPSGLKRLRQPRHASRCPPPRQTLTGRRATLHDAVCSLPLLLSCDAREFCAAAECAEVPRQSWSSESEQGRGL